jgi:hypothetical protein
MTFATGLGGRLALVLAAYGVEGGYCAESASTSARTPEARAVLAHRCRSCTTNTGDLRRGGGGRPSRGVDWAT